MPRQRKSHDLFELVGGGGAFEASLFRPERLWAARDRDWAIPSARLRPARLPRTRRLSRLSLPGHHLLIRLCCSMWSIVGSSVRDGSMCSDLCRAQGRAGMRPYLWRIARRGWYKRECVSGLISIHPDPPNSAIRRPGFSSSRACHSPLLAHPTLLSNHPSPPYYTNGSPLPCYFSGSVSGPLHHHRSRLRLLRLVPMAEAQYDHRPPALRHPQGVHWQGEV
ncbi:hypothetical protein C8Q79DRAFT_98519 [Trametes meyenii]|nr:hypothetical protein C8Q79DRAFT_98519 [Trametes meyenii]